MFRSSSKLPSIFHTAYKTHSMGLYPREHREQGYLGWGAKFSQGTISHTFTHPYTQSGYANQPAMHDFGLEEETRAV